ncbi:MAG TPA: double-strand break repair protein AddB [Stellaceae bacterium]
MQHIYTIAPDRPFLGVVARSLLDKAGGDPLRLARMTVLLPTRRAARALRESFLRLSGEDGGLGAPLLLPRLRPIGDLEADEIALGGGEGTDDPSLAIPPAIPELRRRLLLTQLVLRWGEETGNPLLPGQAAGLATALARLLDAAAIDGADFSRLRELAPDDLAVHWQLVLQFLDILPKAWPGMLSAEGALDAAERRNRLLRRQAVLWRATPPRDPVIAAGLVGGFPALDELLGVVAWLDDGAVILPGLDRGVTAELWDAIADDPAHPQHLIARLLRFLELSPEDVRDWPGPPPASPRQARMRLFGDALLPAAMTDGWRSLGPEPPGTLAGVTRYDCASPQDEAATIALLLRRTLETPAATAALVTPDRELARRVAAELRRWDIDIDDSAGLPLNRTPPGAFLRLVLDAAESGLAPVPLLAVLKHPLAAGGWAPERFRERARRLEDKIRGPRPAPGFAGLRKALDPKYESLHRFINRLERCLGDLVECLTRDPVTIAEIAAAHIAAAERLAASDEESGIARLWQDLDGEAAARFCHELIDAAGDFPPIPARHYPALFEALASGIVVRPAFGRHPRLAIWGLVEARLQQADLVVLGGLNEGTWPGPAAFDPWMSRQMREEFGIAVPERAIGIAAHDFIEAIGAPEVALTRATRREGVPTIPSRWLLRLDAVLRATGLEGALAAEAEIEDAVALLDVPERRRPLPPVAPRPPVKARPRELPVTQIEMWMRDPYAVYARYILKLRALDELDAEPGAAELGTTVHDALAEFVKQYPRDLPADPEAALIGIAQKCFAPLLSRPGAWAFWWPRFQRIARWFVEQERLRRADIADSISEKKGKLAIPAPGGAFTVTAIADRIDRLHSGEVAILDYKTGSLPSKPEIDNGIAVQLPLEGAIARAGGFEGISGIPAALEYWRLSGGEPAGERKALGEDDPQALIDRTMAKVSELVARFDDPATPYLPVPILRWKPRYSDYQHLERLEEDPEDELL